MAAKIPAGQFKAKRLALLDEVRDNRSEFVITKRGKPVARLVPVEAPKPLERWGRMKGTLEILGDIVGPTGQCEVTKNG